MCSASTRALAAAPIVPVVQPFEDPIPAEVADGKLDLVTLMFNYHDMGFLNVDRAAMNKAVFKALKPGGFFVIGDHSGRPGTGISESGTLHRIEEAFLRKEVEAADTRELARFLPSWQNVDAFRRTGAGIDRLREALDS